MRFRFRESKKFLRTIALERGFFFSEKGEEGKVLFQMGCHFHVVPAGKKRGGKYREYKFNKQIFTPCDFGGFKEMREVLENLFLKNIPVP